MVKLFIFSGYGHNQSYELVGESVNIGRSEENDIQISDMSVSRTHLNIMEKDGSFFVKDLNSQNGTYVNGTRIKPDEYYEIKENCPIVIGMTLICIGKMCPDHIKSSWHIRPPFGQGISRFGATTFFRPFTDIRNRELITNINKYFILHQMGRYTGSSMTYITIAEG
jgi:hypothetical protein